LPSYLTKTMRTTFKTWKLDMGHWIFQDPVKRWGRQEPHLPAPGRTCILHLARALTKAGVRQPRYTKKQTIVIGKHVHVESQFIKYQFDPTSEAFFIIQLNTSDKFHFFGTILGKATISIIWSWTYCNHCRMKLQLAYHLSTSWI
jgi:hypothetical protein